MKNRIKNDKGNAKFSFNIMLRPIDIVPGGRAEVVGITSKGILGHNQRGTLLVTRPGKKPWTLRLSNKDSVTKALAKVAEYNALCAAASGE